MRVNPFRCCAALEQGAMGRNLNCKFQTHTTNNFFSVSDEALEEFAQRHCGEIFKTILDAFLCNLM